MGANDTNTTADHEAINLEAEAIADEFNRLMTTSTYKGRDIYNDTANGLYVSMGGRDQEMTFGIGRINYTAMPKTDANARTIVGAIGDPASPTVDGPNKGAVFNLAHLPSDAVVAKEYGRAGNRGSLEGATLAANTTYVTKVVSDAEKSWADADNKQAETIGKALVSINGTAVSRTGGNNNDEYNQTGNLTIGDVLVNGAAGVAAGDHEFATVNTGDNAFLAGHEYEIVSLGNSNGNTQVAGSDAASIMGAVTNNWWYGLL